MISILGRLPNCSHFSNSKILHRIFDCAIWNRTVHHKFACIVFSFPYLHVVWKRRKKTYGKHWFNLPIWLCTFVPASSKNFRLLKQRNEMRTNCLCCRWFYLFILLPMNIFHVTLLTLWGSLFTKCMAVFFAYRIAALFMKKCDWFAYFQSVFLKKQFLHINCLLACENVNDLFEFCFQ